MSKKNANISDHLIIKHSLIDRALHWLFAICTLILLITGFLPILGFNFSWLFIHWFTGLVLLVLIIFHILRVIFFQKIKSMFISKEELANLIKSFLLFFKSLKILNNKSGKYSLSAKLVHHVFTLFILITIVTGILMMIKIDSPFWSSNLYYFSEELWGLIYTFHDIGALFLITLVIIHVYFGVVRIRLLRSMITGLITKDEYEKYYDKNQWKLDD